MRRIASGQFELSTSAREAIGFFTPEGERRWVPEWMPTYPAGTPSESSGTIFTTGVGGMQTFWVVQKIDRAEQTVAYSRITPGRHAGSVWVSCDDLERGGCMVSVNYDMSLLEGGHPSELDSYDDRSFVKMMHHWSETIGHKI